MAHGLEVEVKRGRGLRQLIHPEIPMSFIKGRYNVAINAGASANSFEYIWNCPAAPLNKPWFRWITSGYARSIVVLPTGVSGQYKITAERGIDFIDPRSGRISWSGEGKPLLTTATIEVWDLRG